MSKQQQSHIVLVLRKIFCQLLEIDLGDFCCVRFTAVYALKYIVKENLLCVPLNLGYK